jgi:ribose 1,5-bisphosphokinase
LPDGVRLTTIDNSGALEDAGRVFVEVVRGAARYGL